MASISGLRYITPLFELARDRDALDEVGSGLKAFSLLLEENADLRAALLNPRIPVAKKKQIVLKLTEEHFLPLLRDFFCLVIDKRREQILLFMEREYKRLLLDSRNIITATVQSPVPLDDAYKQDMAKRFESITGKTVELNEEHVPDLIAGVRIMLGSRMLDGSLKARLNGMQRHLKLHTAVAGND